QFHIEVSADSQVEYNDNLTQCADKLNECASKLPESTDELTDTADELSDTADELSDAAEELSDTEEELTDTIEELVNNLAAAKERARAAELKNKYLSAEIAVAKRFALFDAEELTDMTRKHRASFNRVFQLMRELRNLKATLIKKDARIRQLEKDKANQMHVERARETDLQQRVVELANDNHMLLEIIDQLRAAA
ncbi:hypothetical protein LPJ73_008298, partial [Coemansia sp. RSA 2703]